jgi:glucuronyl/N-acetylglucosaminyl transferase EXT2
MDLLSQSYVRVDESSRILSLLSHFNDSSSRQKDRSGSNHLIFNFIPGSYPSYNRRIDMQLADAMIAGGGFDSWSFRSGFDIAVPVPSAFSADCCNISSDHRKERAFLLSSAQYEYVSADQRRLLSKLQSVHRDKVLLISDRCNSNQVLESDYTKVKRCTPEKSIVQYPVVLSNCTFCLVMQTAYLSTPLISESLMTGCIPVIAADDAVLPFEEKIDWKRVSIRIREQLIPEVVSILSHISSQRIYKMRMYGSHVYETYFKSVKAITLTTLQILNDRLIPSSIQRKDSDIRCHDANEF